MSDIIVLAEQQNGKLANATLHALGAAQQIAALTGGTYDIAVAGGAGQVGGVAQKLAGYGAAKVYTLADATLEQYTAQAYAQAFGAAAKAAGARFVIAAATSIGKDCTPRVAARLGAGQASDIIGIAEGAGGLVYTRPMWAGGILGQVKINTPIQVLTVRPTDFDAATASGGASAIEAIGAGVDKGSLRMKYVGLEAAESTRPALTDADVVISGGRGLKEAKNFDIVEKLADLLGGAVGATRAVVDAGWVPNDLQVGQTGKVVAPKLYVAVGISGAIQHLAGMKGSKTIVAINKDPDAPIFSVADYGLVADLFDAMPELTNKLAARK
ncbi:MAG: electron transfer flavoprotein subunit alpha/FixB family protein [Myxococcales bacterium]|nr:electron transfer flavoprotein subunit alpha/FixB family protein [Myxococcales bacterium]